MARRVGIVGNGRVGGAFARALAAAGDEIVAVIGRGEPLDALATADVVIVAVPDDALDAVAAAVCVVAAPHALLVHTCAARDLSMFVAHGARVGMLHPATPVASAEQPLAGVTFGVIGTLGSNDELASIVASIGGRIFWLDESQRLRYHAALVHASNHLVALAADAMSLLGHDPWMLQPLLQRTVDNIERMGPDAALTGPVVRGDADTVRAHLSALPDEMRASYRENARRALALARRSGRLPEDRAVAIEAVLDEDPS